MPKTDKLALKQFIHILAFYNLQSVSSQLFWIDDLFIVIRRDKLLHFEDEIGKELFASDGFSHQLCCFLDLCKGLGVCDHIVKLEKTEVEFDGLGVDKNVPVEVRRYHVQVVKGKFKFISTQFSRNRINVLQFLLDFFVLKLRELQLKLLLAEAKLVVLKIDAIGKFIDSLEPRRLLIILFDMLNIKGKELGDIYPCFAQIGRIT